MIKIPIIRLGKILLTSVQMELSDHEALEFQNDLINKIAETEALGIAIDITSLDVVDSYMARIFNDTVSMARLLGADVVISGIQPFVAMTLVEMGGSLIQAECAFNLEQALKKLEARLATRGDLNLKRDGHE